MYIIRIDQTITTRKMLRKSWERIGEDDNGKPIMGYTPEVETLVTESKEVYSQVVDEMDLIAVINAVNNTEAT